MATDLKRLMRGIGLGSEMIDYASAFASGVVDGFLLKGNLDIVFLIKNIGIPVADIFAKGLIPKGLKDHAVGQLGLIAILMLK